jgi:hypothetical protein
MNRIRRPRILRLRFLDFPIFLDLNGSIDAAPSLLTRPNT